MAPQRLQLLPGALERWRQMPLQRLGRSRGIAHGSFGKGSDSISNCVREALGERFDQRGSLPQVLLGSYPTKFNLVGYDPIGFPGGPGVRRYSCGFATRSRAPWVAIGMANQSPRLTRRVASVPSSAISTVNSIGWQQIWQSSM